MSKVVTNFSPGNSETDDIVRRWMERNNIDQSLVDGYTISRRSGELPTIELRFYFDDKPEVIATYPNSILPG